MSQPKRVRNPSPDLMRKRQLQNLLDQRGRMRAREEGPVVGGYRLRPAPLSLAVTNEFLAKTDEQFSLTVATAWRWMR